MPTPPEQPPIPQAGLFDRYVATPRGVVVMSLGTCGMAGAAVQQIMEGHDIKGAFLVVGTAIAAGVTIAAALVERWNAGDFEVNQPS